MSSNTNTLFWVITGAVIVLAIFGIVKYSEDESLSKIYSKFSGLFSELSNKGNIEKYYSHESNLENIKINDKEDFKFNKNTGEITGYNGSSSIVTIPYEIDGVKVTKIGSIGMDMSNKYDNYQSCKYFLEREKRNPDDEFNQSEREYYEQIGILDGNVCKEPVMLEGMIIPNSVEEIEDNAFWGAESLKFINLPSSIKRIGRTAFFGAGLESINLSHLNQLTYIGDYAFNNNYITGDLVLPDSLEYLGYYSFGGNDITNIVLSKNLDKLQDLTFFANTNLKSVTFRGNETKVGSDDIFYSRVSPIIYVPSGSLNWYKSFSYLKKYTIKEV